MRLRKMSIILVFSMLLSMFSGTYIVEAFDDTKTVYEATVAGGNGFTLFIDAESRLYGYGENKNAQIGNAEGVYVDKPFKIMDNVKSVFAGSNHVLIIDKNDDLYGFGDNTFGQLGEVNTDVEAGKANLIMQDVKTASAGEGYSLVVTNDGTLFAFGKNYVGQLGVGSNHDAKVPVEVMKNVKSVSAGVNHSLLVTNDGVLYGFGNNDLYQLGVDGADKFLSPVEIMKDVKSVSAGATHSFVIKNNGDLYGFGSNSYKQISPDFMYIVKTPQLVLKGVEEISAGFTGTMLRKTDDSVYLFGKFYNDDEKIYKQFESQRYPIANFHIGFNDSIYITKPDGTMYEIDFNKNNKKVKLLENAQFSSVILDSGAMLHYNIAKRLYDRGTFSGINPDEFEPALMKVTTATEALVIMGRVFNWDIEEGADTDFTDVPDWASPYVKYAVDHGITNGVSEEVFGADAMSGKRMFTWVVAQLGEDKADVWENPEKYSEKYSIGVPSTYLRNDLVYLIYESGKVSGAKPKDLDIVEKNPEDELSASDTEKENEDIKEENVDSEKEREDAEKETVDAEEQTIDAEEQNVDADDKNELLVEDNREPEKLDAAVESIQTIVDNKSYHIFDNIKAIKTETARLKEIQENSKLIAITFDDGPSEHTVRLLDALKKYDAKCTFFVLGCCAHTYPDILVKVRDDGHEIANHSYKHPDLARLSYGNIVSQVDSCDDAIRNIAGVETTLLRPPYGSFNSNVKNILKAKGKSIILWDIDTRDWANKNVEYVKNYVINNSREDSIMLLHDLHSTSVDGFIAALPTLINQGYKLVTVTDLMKAKGKILVPGEVYTSGR